MKSYYLLSLILIMILSGCKSSNEPKPSPSPVNLSSMYSTEEGKYYLVALGTNEEQELEFQQVFDENIEKIAGSYLNGSPNEVELQKLNIHEMPVYIVIGTEKEIFRTDHLSELNQFLHDDKFLP
ncbi:hypothetical protein [Paenibacillus glycanilyticus]|uniref:Small peptidoglycan-associated lipoprotein n=1 Tax=Paenibacillus glycanilyticus TaxID=126569 RepID=A0ABQ6GBI4_9BACL|nr:hypothetical protein [Paenibacillus glycanilyticus]GLX67583.1 hypothetical protein MU1_19280 [Paenibacillus glycanilyticus]